MNAAIGKLLEAFSLAREENWDGYGAKPANLEAADYTIQLLRQLPDHLIPPHIDVDNDGDVALDWDYGPRQILSVRIGEGGTVFFSILLGSLSVYGEAYIDNHLTGGLL